MNNTYQDDDLVYVDPDHRAVIGKVEFLKSGNAKPLQMPEGEAPVQREGGRSFKPRKRFYPWGTYRSMRKLYKIDGGLREEERRLSLDEAMQRCSTEVFWN
ncbi:hypothetical protein FJZ27_02340 [Candidatus Peribacteria bacterium]|nr:hypothetical protein [Candidatus Peribacteria bacterium]